MNGPEQGKPVEFRHLRPGEAVCCDGRIYWDASGQGWMGHAIRLDSEEHYQLLLAEAAAFKRRQKRERSK